MRNLVIILTFLFTCSTVFGQVKTKKPIETKDKNVQILTDRPIITDVPLVIMNTIPEFNGVKPINLGGAATLNTNIARVPNITNNKVRMVGRPELTIVPANVNGTLTPRNPYRNSSAYLDFFGADINTATNETRCKCNSSGLTYVNLNFRGVVDERYIITIEASPVGESAGVSMFTPGFLHNAQITQPKQKIDIVLRPSATGMIKLWTQCQDPNTGRRSWIFHAATIKKIES